MRVKLTLFMAVVMILCGQSISQVSSDVETYDRETIYFYDSFLGNGFVKNGQIMSLGTFGSNLEREMAGSENAMDEMAKARRYGIIGATSGLVTTVVQIASIAVYIWDSDYFSKPGFQIATIGIGGAAGILSMGFNRRATGAMNRAIWLYNRDAILGRLHYKTEGARGWQ